MGATCNESAIVETIRPDGKATIVIKRAEACHACSAKGACQTLGGQTQDLHLVVQNTLDAKPGDEVVVALLEASVIKASATLYLIPAIGLVGGATLGWALAEDLGLGVDPASILGAGVGLLIGFLTTKRVAGRMAKEPKYTPKMISLK